MHYIIASIREVQTGFMAELHKNGNKYMVYANDEETDTRAYKKYDDINEAERVFAKLVHCIIQGLYNAKDRLAMLE